jgi:hypothetical protein
MQRQKMMMMMMQRSSSAGAVCSSASYLFVVAVSEITVMAYARESKRNDRGTDETDGHCYFPENDRLSSSSHHRPRIEKLL